MANELVSSGQEVKMLREFFLKRQEGITGVLPRGMGADRFTQIAIDSIMRNPTLLKADRLSLYMAVKQAAKLGLEIDGALGHAVLLCYGGNVQLIIGYKGMLMMARRSGEIKMFDAEVVYENEPFTISRGVNADIKHTPLAPSERGEKIIGAYAVAYFTNGGHQFVFVWAEDLEKTRDEATKRMSVGAKNYSPWVKYYPEMCKKTAIRRLCKYLPLTPEAARAFALYDQADAGVPQTYDYDVTVEEDQDLLEAPLPRLTELKEKM